MFDIVIQQHFFLNTYMVNELNCMDRWILIPLQTSVSIWKLGMECDPVEISRHFCFLVLLRRDKCLRMYVGDTLWMLQYNKTPLICAALKGHVEAVNALLVNGADIEAKGQVMPLLETVSLWLSIIYSMDVLI